MQPQFVTIFHALIRFKVAIWLMSTEVDIFSQFHWLETLEAGHLCLPVYPVETDIQLVHTLKYMKTNKVSVQWMAGCTFPNLKECEIIEPLNPEMVALGFGVDLPICMKFTYDAESINTLVNFCLPFLTVPSGAMFYSRTWGAANLQHQLTGASKTRKMCKKTSKWVGAQPSSHAESYYSYVVMSSQQEEASQASPGGHRCQLIRHDNSNCE